MTIQELLDGIGIKYVESGGHHHARPGWIQLEECPFCHSGEYHLGYNLRLGYFNCWRCSSHHTVQVLVHLGIDRSDAEEFWQSRQLSPLTRLRKRSGLREPPGRTPLGPPHKLYLQGRGFDPEEIERTWGIEAISLAHRLSWRIYIPIVQDGRKVSWTTRSIGEKVAQRYISASAGEEAFNHKELVYGLDYCHHSIVIVEGPTDAWRIGPGAGALFGTAFSTAQVRLLSSIPHRFVCFDSAKEAQGQARKLARQLACFPGETINLEIQAKDPGSASAREIGAIRREAKLCPIYRLPDEDNFWF